MVQDLKKVGYLLDPDGPSAFYQPQKGGVFAGPRWPICVLSAPGRWGICWTQMVIRILSASKKWGICWTQALFLFSKKQYLFQNKSAFTGQKRWGICWTRKSDSNSLKWGICWTHVGYLLDPCGVFAVPKAHFLVKSGVFAVPGGVFAGPKWGICWTHDFCKPLIINKLSCGKKPLTI